MSTKAKLLFLDLIKLKSTHKLEAYATQRHFTATASPGRLHLRSATCDGDAVMRRFVRGEAGNKAALWPWPSAEVGGEGNNNIISISWLKGKLVHCLLLNKRKCFRWQEYVGEVLPVHNSLTLAIAEHVTVSHLR